jgi:hypothetical protein
MLGAVTPGWYEVASWALTKGCGGIRGPTAQIIPAWGNALSFESPSMLTNPRFFVPFWSKNPGFLALKSCSCKKNELRYRCLAA